MQKNKTAQLSKLTLRRMNIKQRVQVELTLSKDELEELAISCGFDTKKELFHNSLALLTWAIKNTQNGMKLYSKDDKGNVVELLMPFMEHIRLTHNRRKPR